MIRKKLTKHDWLKSKLEIISEIGRKVRIDGITTEYAAYTALKLIAIHYYSEVFSQIARHPNRRLQGFDGAVYLDLFAGTGLVKLTDTNDFVGGSVPCAVMTKSGYDYCICVEIKKDRCEILEKRLSKILKNNEFKVINGDCNECINQVIELIKIKFKRPIIFTVIDPEGMEIKFSTLKALADSFKSCDFMISVTTSGVSRVAGKFEKGITNIKKSLENYLDQDAHAILQQLAEGETPQSLYQGQIEKILGKPIGDTIPIHKKGKDVAYYLLGYTRSTKAGSQYGKSLSKLKKQIEWADRTHVKNALDQIYNRAGTIDSYF